jgi:hypothetical protein
LPAYTRYLRQLGPPVWLHRADEPRACIVLRNFSYTSALRTTTPAFRPGLQYSWALVAVLIRFHCCHPAMRLRVSFCFSTLAFHCDDGLFVSPI